MYWETPCLRFTYDVSKYLHTSAGPGEAQALLIIHVSLLVSFYLSLSTVPMGPARFWSVLDLSWKTPFFIIFHKKFNKTQHFCIWTTSSEWSQFHINIPGKDSNWFSLGMCLPWVSVRSRRWDSVLTRPIPHANFCDAGSINGSTETCGVRKYDVGNKGRRKKYYISLLPGVHWQDLETCRVTFRKGLHCLNVHTLLRAKAVLADPQDPESLL